LSQGFIKNIQQKLNFGIKKNPSSGSSVDGHQLIFKFQIFNWILPPMVSLKREAQRFEDENLY
jgi:hypothetical protein